MFKKAKSKLKSIGSKIGSAKVFTYVKKAVSAIGGGAKKLAQGVVARAKPSAVTTTSKGRTTQQAGAATIGAKPSGAKGIIQKGKELFSKLGQGQTAAQIRGKTRLQQIGQGLQRGAQAVGGAIGRVADTFAERTRTTRTQSVSPNLPNYVPPGVATAVAGGLTPAAAASMQAARTKAAELRANNTPVSPQLNKQLSTTNTNQTSLDTTQNKVVNGTDTGTTDTGITDYAAQDSYTPPEPTVDPALLNTAQTLTNQGQTPEQIAENLQQTGADISGTDVQGMLQGGSLAGAIPTESYLVQPGDTLNAIAGRMGVAVSDISGYRSGNANVIYPGENLTITRNGTGVGSTVGNTGVHSNVGSTPTGTTLPEETPLTTNEQEYETYLKEKTYEDIYKTLTEQLGLDDVKNRINEVNDELQKLQDDRTEEENDINNNPWISESLRIKKIQSLGGKYDQKEANLRESIKNTQQIYDDAREEAKFAAKLYIDQANENREFYYKVKQDAEEMKLKREDATPDIQEYKLAQTQGYAGSFLQYQREMANLKAKATGNGTGLTPGQINTTVNSIAGAFDNEPIVKSYNTVQEGYQTLQGIGTQSKNPADDIAFIYAFAKVMDPNSVVREGEYNTIQKYAQTWADSFGFKAKRVFSNTNFLTPQAKQNMLNTLQSKVGSITTQYNNLYNQYQKQIQGAYAGQPRQITQYTPPSFTAPTTTTQTTPSTTQDSGGFLNNLISFFTGD